MKAYLSTVLLALSACACGGEEDSCNFSCPAGASCVVEIDGPNGEESCALPDGTKHGPFHSWYGGDGALCSPACHYRGAFDNGEMCGVWRYDAWGGSAGPGTDEHPPCTW